MAYLAFTDAGVAAMGESTAPAIRSRGAVRPHLSALEWSVVALARNDRLASLRMPGRIANAMGALFGGVRDPRLADPRLEALRRIAVLSRHQGYTVAPTEIRAFVAAGFSEDQYELIVDSLHAAIRNAGAYA